MIVLLFCICVAFLIISLLKSKLGYLSPTFVTSVMFSLSAFIYVLRFDHMLGDISILTVFVITVFLFAIFIAETLAVIGLRPKTDNKTPGLADRSIIIVKPKKILLLTVIFLVVAFTRFQALVALVNSSGKGYSGILEMMSVARDLFVKNQGDVVLGNFFFNQLVYLCEILTYIMFYFFVHNYMIGKKLSLNYLLPMIPHLFICFTSTSRTSFLLLIVAIVFCIFTVSFKKHNCLKMKIPPFLVLFVLLFGIAFVIYGMMRNDVSSTPLINYLEMYTSSALYNLDNALVYGFHQPDYFGFYTLNRLYNNLGIEHSGAMAWFPMTTFSIDGYHSNIYTSLLEPVMDFGIVGMFVVRLVTAFITTKIIAYILYSKKTKVIFCSLLYFSITTLYCFIFSSHGDVFKDYFLDLSVILRYLLYGALLTLFIKPMKYTFGEEKENEICRSSCHLQPEK